MPDIDIFDKIEDYLKYQEELYGPELFLSGVELFPPEPVAKLDYSGVTLHEEGTKEVADYSGVTLQQEDTKIVMEKGIKYSEDLSNKMFSSALMTSPTFSDNEVDSLTRKLNKASSVSPDWYNCNSLEELNTKINKCTDCPLAATRTNFVFGVGNPKADIVIIGEAPGADEDARGEPFVGRAGQLLTKILQAIGLERDQVFICNILKCRPPGNRRPSSEEVDECEPYLVKQIDLIKPAFILALGLTAVDTLLKNKHKMADTRGKFFDYRGYQMLVTYHPSALLRNPNLKKPTWEDVQLLRKMYDEYLNKK